MEEVEQHCEAVQCQGHPQAGPAQGRAFMGAARACPVLLGQGQEAHRAEITAWNLTGLDPRCLV